MRERLLYEQEIINEMNTALEKEQFEVWFQPIYNHSSGARVGAEALVRWRHPIHGLIPPNELIPTFERNGFVYELDKYVWESVCKYLRTWLDEGIDSLLVSVNISRYDLLKDDLYDVIVGLVNKYNLPISMLRIEITESAFAKDNRRVLDVVKLFVYYGFTVEIDDFGVGYSSLNTLKDVPAQVLKIDMSFLSTHYDGASQSGEQRISRGGTILESVVRMAKWLGMAVIAEGVETVEQANYLKSIGCDYVQGYLYARPMPAHEYIQHIVGVRKEEKLLTVELVENYDNNKFWDPTSLDTLVFNTYVGGACIIELHNDHIEILRANDKFAKMVGGENCTIKDILSLNLEDHICDHSRETFFDSVHETLRTCEDVVCELQFLDLYEKGRETYLHTTMRVIARTTTRSLFYMACFNITQHKLAERHKLLVRQQLQAIMSNVVGGISATIIDNDGKINFIFANDYFYSMLGYTEQQYHKEVDNPLVLVVPEDLGRVKKIISSLT
ncbi:MAG: EAL domain-containing protein [Clostridia bacterium]|nr:EAL domain-containing protein [Clostridia bacterium]